jgi:hypothetical protein
MFTAFSLFQERPGLVSALHDRRIGALFLWRLVCPWGPFGPGTGALHISTLGLEFVRCFWTFLFSE